MKTLSLKLDDSIFKETEELVKSIKQPRNRYINDALKYYNIIKRKELLAKQLKFESDLVKEESLKILSDLEQIADEY